MFFRNLSARAGEAPRVHPLGAGYDFGWPFPRKLAYLASLVLTVFWCSGYALYLILPIVGWAIYGKDAWDELTQAQRVLTGWVLPLMWLASAALLAAVLIRALVLRRRGWYAKSAAVQGLPVAPFILQEILCALFRIP